MNVKQLWTDDDAVSPVIGVILMVAITVILAAVIATFVLGLGDQVSDTAPQASFSFDWAGSSGASSASELTIRHGGGDSIEATNLYIRGDPGTASGTSSLGDDWNTYASSSVSDVSAGDRTGPDVGPEGEVDVVWEDQANENSATLGQWDGPDA